MYYLFFSRLLNLINHLSNSMLYVNRPHMCLYFSRTTIGVCILNIFLRFKLDTSNCAMKTFKKL